MTPRHYHSSQSQSPALSGGESQTVSAAHPGGSAETLVITDDTAGIAVEITGGS